MASALPIEMSALFLLVCGCAGAVTGQSTDDGASAAPSSADAAGRAGEAGAASTEIESAGAGGELSGKGSEERAGAANAGAGTANAAAGNADPGAGNANAAGSSNDSPAAAARVESGTRLCIDPRDCRGLDCISSEQSTAFACLAACDSDADCKADEHCFERMGLRKSCFQSCQESPVVCNYQFDCADYYRIDQYLCLPKAWVRSWPPTNP
jgi:hypothetical protein